MFWNLPNNKYAKNFSSERLCYLHANFFWNNFMNFEELKNFDYLIRIDDDSWFKNRIEIDFFEQLDDNNKLCGSAYTWNFVSRRVLETRENFFKFIKDYVKKYNVDVKSPQLKQYISQREINSIDEIKYHKNFHSMKFLCGNCNIYNRKLFESEDWKNYLSEFNKIAGGYRFRWGDCEIISMFYYLHIGDEFLDLDLINRNLYNNQIDNMCYDILYKNNEPLDFSGKRNFMDKKNKIILSRKTLNGFLKNKFSS